jgi:hypothetical protein
MRDEVTRDGTGDGIGDPEFRGTFWVMVMFTGVVTVLRTLKIVNKDSFRFGGRLTAATTVKLPLVTQLCGVWTMTESETGNPLPPLLYVWIRPVEDMTTLKDEMEEAIGKLTLKE